MDNNSPKSPFELGTRQKLSFIKALKETHESKCDTPNCTKCAEFDRLIEEAQAN